MTPRVLDQFLPARLVNSRHHPSLIHTFPFLSFFYRWTHSVQPRPRWLKSHQINAVQYLGFLITVWLECMIEFLVVAVSNVALLWRHLPSKARFTYCPLKNLRNSSNLSYFPAVALIQWKVLTVPALIKDALELWPHLKNTKNRCVIVKLCTIMFSKKIDKIWQNTPLCSTEKNHC